LSIRNVRKSFRSRSKISLQTIFYHATGVLILRRMSIFGNTSAPIGEVQFTDVRVPADHLLGEEGMGFRVGQERLGPARVHHCMRAIGNCEVLTPLL